MKHSSPRLANTANQANQADQDMLVVPASQCSDVLAEFLAKAREGPRRGFQWTNPRLLTNALVLHYTTSAAAAHSIAKDGFNVGARVEMSHNTRRVTGLATEQGRLVYGLKLGSAKRGFDNRRDFVVLRAPQAIEAFNVGDGNIQTVVDRLDASVVFVGRNNSVHGMFDGEWQTRESWRLQTPTEQVVLDGVTWKRIKTYLDLLAPVAGPVDARMLLEPSSETDNSNDDFLNDDPSPRG